MKKLLYALVGIVLLSCTKDRTELLHEEDKGKVKIGVSLSEKRVLEVTLKRSLFSESDSTYIEVKNVSGKPVHKIEFYLENCTNADATTEDCAPDYHFSMTKTDGLKNGETAIAKTNQFINLEYPNEIHITTFQSDTTKNHLLAGRYMYSKIEIRKENLIDTTSYSGSGKMYVLMNGRIFYRGSLYEDNNPKLKKIQLIGSIYPSNEVIIKYKTEDPDLLPILFTGKVVDKKLSVKAFLSKDSNEFIDILLMQ